MSRPFVWPDPRPWLEKLRPELYPPKKPEPDKPEPPRKPEGSP